MNPEISVLFDEIAELEEFRGVCYESGSLMTYFKAGYEIYGIKVRIKEISATLNPQIPEPYASMSRDEILGGIGQYEKMVLVNTNEW